MAVPWRSAGFFGAWPVRWGPGPRGPTVLTPRRGTTRPITGHDHEHFRNGWKWNASIRGALTGKTNANESAALRLIPAINSFQLTISCVCGAFHPHLFRPFRATDVRGWPLTQGGARRQRRLALPWANLFCPFGQRCEAFFRRRWVVFPVLAVCLFHPDLACGPWDRPVVSCQYFLADIGTFCRSDYGIVGHGLARG